MKLHVIARNRTVEERPTARALKRLLKYTATRKLPIVSSSQQLWEESRLWEGPACQEWPCSFLVHVCTLWETSRWGLEEDHTPSSGALSSDREQTSLRSGGCTPGGFGWSSCPIWGMWHTLENDTRVSVFSVESCVPVGTKDKRGNKLCSKVRRYEVTIMKNCANIIKGKTDYFTERQ